MRSEARACFFFFLRGGGGGGSVLGFRVSVLSSTGLPNLCARRLCVSSYSVVSGSEDEVD